MNSSYFNVFAAISEAALIVKIVLLLLLLLSVYSWGIILNKLRLIRKNTVVIKKMRKLIKEQKDDIGVLNKYLNKLKTNNPYRPILKFLINHKKILIINNNVNQIIIDTIYAYLYEINLQLENRLSSLATIGTVAPFIGLFGTVLGIINSFSAIGSSSSASLAILAPGIAEALYSTAIGLFVAVPAVFAYNIFVSRIENYKEQQNILVHEFIINFIRSHQNTTDKEFNNSKEEEAAAADKLN